MTSEVRGKLFRVCDTRLRDNTLPRFNIACDRLLGIVSKVLENPNDPKYRRIKTRSQAFVELIKIQGAEAFLIELGFKSECYQLEEFLVAPYTVPIEDFVEALDVLTKFKTSMNTPVARSPYDEQADRERILRQIEEDKMKREANKK
eukprot:c696_g1_i1.p1 GENE.c696_g1_i1~~c696_g1_i1.p1  ORF type:complete len:147 (+),score=26.53 c696_g1_i1:31-471(+)